MLKVNIQLRRDRFALDVAYEQTSRITGVFGPSGAGKSSLMHAIAGLITPDSGRIELDGEVLFDRASGINLPPHHRRIGVMFQDDRLFPHYSVEGNLRYSERAANVDRVSEQARRSMTFDGVASMLELRDLLPRRVPTLSGGERQRVALGRALLSNPRLLLLDEPLSSLDAGLKRQIIPYLRRVRDAAGIPMLYVSHDLTEMLAMTDHLLLMTGGRSIAHGPYRSLAHEHAALDAMHNLGLVNVLRVTVIRHDEPAGVIEVSLDDRGGRAAEESNAPIVRAAIRTPVTPGTVIDITMRASDIALARDRVEGISIQNQLRGTVERVTHHGGRAIVEVQTGRPLLAELTLRAVESLAIEPGKTVWCLIKSNAIGVAGV